MESNRWKTASLAINAIIRGLELDQITFHYDEMASQENLVIAGEANKHALGNRWTSRLLDKNATA